MPLIINFFQSGGNKDYVIVGTDSGKITILEFDTTSNRFKPVHCEVYGKTGCRRIVPGQYLAADPKGRAIMIGMKLHYIIKSTYRNSAYHYYPRCY